MLSSEQGVDVTGGRAHRTFVILVSLKASKAIATRTPVHLSVVGAVFVAFGLGSGLSGAQQLLPLNRPPALEIGALDSPEEEVFGRLRDVAIGSGGDLFILDNLVNELRWFDARGRYLGRAGRDGQGPGEFSGPVALTLDDSGLVHVLDVRNSRISVFEPTPDGLLLRRDHRVPFAHDLCIIGSRRYLLLPSAVGGGHLIHEIDEGGETLQSFALPDPPDPQLLRRLAPVGGAGAIREIFERGSLACDPASGVIVLLSQATPIIRAYTASGGELWRTELADYSRVSYGEIRNGWFGQIPDPRTGTAHTGTAAFFIGEFVYVTLYEGGPADPEGNLELRVLRRSDGIEVARQPSPLRLVAHRDGKVVGFIRQPFPRVAVYSVR